MKPVPHISFFPVSEEPAAVERAWDLLTEGEFSGTTRSLPPARFTIHDTYDGRLARAGWELTVIEPRRVRGERHWRLLAEDGTVLALEAHPAGVSPGLAGELPSEALVDHLEPLIEERRLLPLAEVTVEGEERAVHDARQKTVARVRRVRARVSPPGDGKGGEAVELPARLDIEGVRGYDDAFEAVRTALAEVNGLAAGEESLRDAALSALGRPPRGVSSKIRVSLTPDLSAGEAARRVYRHLLDTLEAQEDGTRRDLDPEFLHDFRVAVRRTRSGLSRIKKVLPAERVEHFKNEFRWLGRVSGPTRDLDVFLLLLPEYRRALPEAVRADLDPLEAHLVQRQRAEQKTLAKVLKGRRYRKLIRDWRAFLDAERQDGDEAPANAAKPVRAVASKRIRRLYKRMVRDGRALDPKGPAEPFHELRKDGKKLRYLMEFFRSLYPADEIGSRIAELKKLQDVLGTFNDLSVQRESLVRLGREMASAGNAPPETLMALGHLAEILRREQQATRRRFDKRFRAFASDDSRHRMKETFS